MASILFALLYHKLTTVAIVPKVWGAIELMQVYADTPALKPKTSKRGAYGDNINPVPTPKEGLNIDLQACCNAGQCLAEEVLVLVNFVIGADPWFLQTACGYGDVNPSPMWDGS